MLSVLIETRNDAEALARTLAALVGAAVEGVVREVIVCDDGSTDQTQRVAEHAGCHFVGEGGLVAGLRQAKGDWLLLLEPGARPVEGWIEPVLDHIGAQSTPARFTPRQDDGASFLSRLLSGRRALAAGLLIGKSDAEKRLQARATGELLARGLWPRRLSARMRVAAGRKG